MTAAGIHPLARRVVRDLQPPEPLLRDAALGRRGATDLASNVNPLGGADAAYPPALASELQARYAAFLSDEEGISVAPDRMLLTEGSISAIDLLVRTFCEPGRDRVCVSSPTFPFYARAAALAEAEVVDVPLRGTAYERLDVSATVRAGARLTFLCSPGNPVGSALDAGDVLAVADASAGLVVVDEAYVEFSDGQSLAGELDRAPNLVVLRSFSKAWGLAAVRAGALLADAAVVAAVRLVQLTYGFGAPARRLVTARLDDPSPMRRYVELVRRERGRVTAALRELPCVVRVYPSEANFVLVEVAGGAAVDRALDAANLVVGRPPGVGGALRIAIGLPEDNDRVLTALGGVELSAPRERSRTPAR